MDKYLMWEVGDHDKEEDMAIGLKVYILSVGFTFKWKFNYLSASMQNAQMFAVAGVNHWKRKAFYVSV